MLFDSRTIWTEARPPQTILTRDAPPAADLLVACAWCKKLDVGKENWREFEEAVRILNLSEIENLPLISYGMCRVCYQTMSEKLKNIQSS